MKVFKVNNKGSKTMAFWGRGVLRTLSNIYDEVFYEKFKMECFAKIVNS